MHSQLFEKQNYKIKYDGFFQAKTSFSKTYQIIWIVEGSGSMLIGQHQIDFGDDSLFYIPVGMTYILAPDDKVNLTKIYIPKKAVELSENLINVMFDIDNIKAKQAIATYLFKFNKRADFDIQYESQQLMSELLAHALNTELPIQPVHDSRVLDCIEYIELHLKNRFTVSDIAKSLHINTTYLSTLFKNEVGTSIVKYTNNLRLESAIKDIRLTNKSITQIAFDHGFADVRTLNEYIKAKYSITSLQIRQRISSWQNNELGPDPYTALIDKYKLTINFDAINHINIHANTEKSIGEYSNSFNCIAIGRAHDILYSNVQEQLIQAKKDFNFDYCRFHNIFGDEMNIIDTNYLGQKSFNFQKPLTMIEFLLEHNITPFIELGFFPKEIASDSPSPFTGYQINTGSHIDFELWESLNMSFFNTLKKTFPNDYLNMRFDFWNEVDIPVFWPNSKKELYRLYEITYKTVKKIEPQIQIGGFNYGNFIKDTLSIEEDLDYCEAHDILPDFLTIHSYPLFIEGEFSHQPDLAVTTLNPIYIKDKLNQDIDKLIRLKDKYQFKEVYITEWNTSPMQREHLNDSSYKSSKIISDILNSKSSLIDGICYWTLSDEMAEFGYPIGEVHGGFGLFTRHGIPKPAYYGYLFASRLTGKILQKTENSIILENDAGYMILINNNVDYDRKYYLSKFGTDAQIMEGNTILADIQIKNIKEGIYSKTTTEINSTMNLKPIFETLSEKNPYLTSKERNLLRELSQPKVQNTLLSISDCFDFTVEVKQTCTTLIVLKRQ